MRDLKLAFIGGGNMTKSLIGGLLANGYTAGSIVVSEPRSELHSALQSGFGVSVLDSNTRAVANAEVVLFAVKPQVMETVLKKLRGQINSNTLLISIAAGVSTHSIHTWLAQEFPVIRCMPNTPVQVRSGVSGLYSSVFVDASQRCFVERVFQAVGVTLWLEDEADMDAVTAISGSGPAYYFLLMEALEKAGIELGLSEQAARKLTLYTALGAARLATEVNSDSAELRRRVTSPGGTTEQAINALIDAGFFPLIESAVKSAQRRAQELA